MQAGAVLPAFTAGALVMGEVWAGLLIGLSVCMFAQQRPGVAIALGLTRAVPARTCGALLRRVRGRRFGAEALAGGGRMAGGCLPLRGVLLVALLRRSGHINCQRISAHRRSWWHIGDLTSRLGKGRIACVVATVPTLGDRPCAGGGDACRSSRRDAPARAIGDRRLCRVLLGRRTDRSITYWGLVAWPAWAVASGYGLQAVVDAVRRLVVWKQTPLGAV